MLRRVGHQMDHEDPRNDQRKPNERWCIKTLPEHDKTDDRDEDNAKPGPDRIDNTDRHKFERDAQQIKGASIGQNNHDCRPEPGELDAGLQGRRADRFKQDCERQINIVQGHMGNLSSLNRQLMGVFYLLHHKTCRNIR